MKLTRKDAWIYEVLATDHELTIIMAALNDFEALSVEGDITARYLEERIRAALTMDVGETVSP